MELGSRAGLKKLPPDEGSQAAKTMMVAQLPSDNNGTYRDHSHITDDDKDLNELLCKADSEGVKGTDQTFPVKLHQLLSGTDEDGFSHIVCWQPHGRSFIVKKHSEFVEKVLPCCFRQSKFASFQRQLNLYGFRRITQGRDKGSYYHEFFLRGRNLLALKMQRTKVKGTGARKPSQPESEPDFYSMPFVNEKKSSSEVVVPHSSVSPAATLPTAPSPSAAPLDFPRPSSSSPHVPKLLPPTSLASSRTTSSSGISDSPTRLAVRRMGMDSVPIAPSLARPVSMTGATRQEIIAQMLATTSRLHMLRQSSQGLATSSLGTSSSSQGLFPYDNHYLMGNIHGSQQRGPLHLNAYNMPCNCAVPAF